MKKICSYLLIIFMLMTLVLPMSAFVSGNLTITCENVVCEAGDQVTVKVRISNNPGFSYLELTPTYNSSLTLVTETNGNLISDFTKGKQYVWVADEDVYATGVLMTFTFRVAENVSAGDYSVGFIARTCGNIDEEPVACTIQSGKVTVQEKEVACTHPTTTEHPATASTCTVQGNNRYVTCDDCGVVVSGSDAKLPLAGHTPGAWTVSKPATATTKGEKVKRCTNCNNVLERADIPATGNGDPVDACEIFRDVRKKDWFHNAVTYAYNNNLFSGTSATTFGPNDNMTRGMFVTVLGRLHGVPNNNRAITKFSDVKKGQYYTAYVKWASDNGIVAGFTPSTFGPKDNVTREQICAIMVRYCNKYGINLKKVNAAISFKDAAKISGYARSAVSTCQMGGLVNGEKTNGGYNFRPQGNATRAEVATIIMNFAKTYK